MFSKECMNVMFNMVIRLVAEEKDFGEVKQNGICWEVSRELTD